MRWSIVVAAALIAVRAAGAAETSPPATIRLQLRSEVKVPAEVLEASQREVARIFARSGFEVMWTGAAPRFTVTIITDVLGYDRAASPVMGMVSPTTNGPVARVFFRQVSAFARRYDVDPAAVLGHVIAHEVGHMLLSTPAHSLTGLMRGEWDAAQMRNIARGGLTFTDRQAHAIRRVVSQSR